MRALRISAPPTAPSVTPPPKRVLVVDDLPAICSTFRDVHRRIRSVDAHLVTESNATRALDLASREAFDLVVSDFRMPDADGIAILAAARATNPGGRRVLMTGYNEIAMGLDRIREAAVDAYIQKPLHARELVQLIGALLVEDARVLDECRREARAIEAEAEPSAPE